MRAVMTRMATRTIEGHVLSTDSEMGSDVICGGQPAPRPLLSAGCPPQMTSDPIFDPGIRPKWSVFTTGRGHTTMDRTQDRQLISRLQAGDDTAVRELADRYSPRIYQLALRHMRNQQDAEEVTQDVLMKVYRKVDAFRGDAALSSWIYRITFNTAMSRLRGTRLARQADQERERLLAATEDG